MSQRRRRCNDWMVSRPPTPSTCVACRACWQWMPRAHNVLSLPSLPLFLCSSYNDAISMRYDAMENVGVQSGDRVTVRLTPDVAFNKAGSVRPV